MLGTLFINALGLGLSKNVGIVPSPGLGGGGVPGGGKSG